MQLLQDYCVNMTQFQKFKALKRSLMDIGLIWQLIDMSTRKTREKSQKKEQPSGSKEDNQKYSLRKRCFKSIFESHNLKFTDFNDEMVPGEEQDYVNSPNNLKKKSKKKRKGQKHQGMFSDDELENGELPFQEMNILDRLPDDSRALSRILTETKSKIRHYKAEFIRQQQELRGKASYVAENAIPISADVRDFDWNRLISKQVEYGQRTFDVIMMDPPWKLSSSQPSRGVAIQYESLADEQIEKIPVGKLQQNGFLMVWAINAKFNFTMELMERWGYKVVDTITWVKMTVNGKIAKGHGFYLQHAKETCIIGVKGNPQYIRGVARDVIFSERRGQSQKPTEVYEYVQELVPKGYYLQIFGRRNNLRDRWVTIGNQI